MRAKIAFTIDLLEEFGNGLREPSSKSLGDGILELRIKAGSDISRVFYFFMVGNRAILTRIHQEDAEDTEKGNREGKGIQG